MFEALCILIILAASCVDEDHLNIFLEYVPGGSVTSLLRNYGAFEEPLVRNWVRQILTGLNYLHERDIIHRDIKGANMLVDNKGGIKISDFGISKKVEDSEFRPLSQLCVVCIKTRYQTSSLVTGRIDLPCRALCSGWLQRLSSKLLTRRKRIYGVSAVWSWRC